MRPIVVVDAWHDPSGPVVVTRSRVFGRHVALVRSVRRPSGELRRRTCVVVGDKLVVSEHSGPEALAYKLAKKWSERVPRR